MIQGDHPADAEPMLREALEIRRHAYGDDDPRTAQSKARLGQALLRLQRHVEAEPLLMESQSVLLAAHGEDHVLVRSEERRVGKECSSRWSPETQKKTQKEKETSENQKAKLDNPQHIS